MGTVWSMCGKYQCGVDAYYYGEEYKHSSV